MLNYQRVQIKTKAADELHVNNDDGDKKGCRKWHWRTNCKTCLVKCYQEPSKEHVWRVCSMVPTYMIIPRIIPWAMANNGCSKPPISTDKATSAVLAIYIHLLGITWYNRLSLWDYTPSINGLFLAISGHNCGAITQIITWSHLHVRFRPGSELHRRSQRGHSSRRRTPPCS